MKFQALNDCIIVKPFQKEKKIHKEKKTNSGLIINVLGKKDPDVLDCTKGRVISVGDGIISCGRRVPNECKIGDVVLYPDIKKKKIFDDDETEFHLLNEDNVMAIILKQ